MSPPLLRLQSDERLAELAAEGSNPAFGELARRHRPALVRASRRILHPERAEDAAQQALLSAHLSLRRHGPPNSFRPWLHRIAVNAALKQVRDAPPEAPLDEERVDGVEQPPEAHERSERVTAAIGAIASLPEGQRRALVLRELEGRSHAEIARRLGLTQGAVRQLIHRARNGVRTAVSAVTPYGLLLRAGGEQAADGRLAEAAVAGGTGGAIAGKALATALVAGGLAGGLALAPVDLGEKQGSGQPKQEQDGSGVSGVLPSAEAASSAEDDRSGSSARSNRGPGGGDRDGEDRSGPSDDGVEPDNSGPGSATSGSSGSGSSGSGSGSSGSGSSGSGSSGSGTSGSGTSGSGSGTSGTSGSGTSGSGTSDSGSGSSGSGDDLLD
jgi:RNA polymerase sigma factor (sigma-70 family)